MNKKINLHFDIDETISLRDKNKTLKQAINLSLVKTTKHIWLLMQME